MKPVNFPITARQPFLGLALAAMLGIILADFFPISPSTWLPIGTIFVIAGLAAFRWPDLRSTYALVACGFFLLHNLRIEDTAGLRLAGQLGERPRAVEANGLIVSEPKIASNGFATFLLKLKSIDFESKNQATSATWLVRWRGEPQFGNECKFLGIAESRAATCIEVCLFAIRRKAYSFDIAAGIRFCALRKNHVPGCNLRFVAG